MLVQAIKAKNISPTPSPQGLDKFFIGWGEWGYA